MKRILTLGLVLLTLFAFSGMVYAQAPKADTTKAAPATPAKTAPAATPSKAPEKAKTQPAVATHTISGTVVSVDTVANLIVVKHKKGEATFSVTPATKIKVVGKVAPLADIKKDSRVVVTYKMEGDKKTATAIR